MMRLRQLYTIGKWTVLAPVDEHGACEVEKSIRGLLDDPKTKATAAGLIAMWSRIPSHGPRGLGHENYHRVDAENDIYEFRKRGHRVFCFEAEGALIICSHILKKASQKTPSKDKKRAARLKKEFLSEYKKGNIEVEERNGGARK